MGDKISKIYALGCFEIYSQNADFANTLVKKYINFAIFYNFYGFFKYYKLINGFILFLLYFPIYFDINF